MFGTKHLKTNWLQKTIKYQTNEQITKYSNWNMEMQSCYVYQYNIKLYQASPTQLVSKIILDTLYFNKHLMIK